MLSDLLSIEIKSFTIHDPDIKGKIKFDDEQMFKVKNGSSQSF